MAGATILVVDDDPILRSIVEQILTVAGYKVIEAEDGSVALAVLAVAPVDLVVTDMIMPEVEGVETIFAIKRDWPDMPIIAISAGTQRQDTGNLLKLASAVGAQAAMSKPLIPKMLIETVELLLEQIAAPLVKARQGGV